MLAFECAGIPLASDGKNVDKLLVGMFFCLIRRLAAASSSSPGIHPLFPSTGTAPRLDLYAPAWALACLGFTDIGQDRLRFASYSAALESMAMEIEFLDVIA